MNPRVSRRTKIAGTILLAASALLLLAGTVARTVSFYQPSNFNSKYEGYIYNSTYTELSLEISINIDSEMYESIINDSEGFSEELIDLVNSSAVIDTNIASSLPKYEGGIRDASWMYDKMVYDTYGNLTIVYSTRTYLMVLLQGNVDVGGVPSRVFIIMTGEPQTSGYGFISTVLTWSLVTVVTILVLIFVYVYFFKERRYLRNQEKKIISMGKKRERLERKNSSKKSTSNRPVKKNEK